MKLAEKIKTYGLSFLLMLAPKSAGAQDMQPKASTPEDSVSVNVNIPQITSLIRHQIHNNFTDVPTAEEKDSAIAVPIINMAQYAKDGSVEVKLAHPHDICAPNIDDAMRYVECKTGKQPFNFEQYFKCLPEDEQARFKDLPAFAQTKYRIDCEKYYNDKNNFHNVAAYHNNVRRYIKARKGPNSEWIKKVHRLGPNQADKTIFAMEIAFMACHPDSVIRQFATNFVDVNDEQNREILLQVQHLLYDQNGEMQSGEGAWKNRCKAAKKLEQVKVGNFCVDINGKVLAAKNAPSIRNSKGYRFFSESCLELWQEMDERHCYKLREAINEYVTTVYMAASQKCQLNKIPQNKLFESGTISAWCENFNHQGAFAHTINIAESRYMWQKMNNVNYVTFDFIRHMRNCLPENSQVRRFYEKSYEQIQLVAPQKVKGHPQTQITTTTAIKSKPIVNLSSELNPVQIARLKKIQDQQQP